MKLEMPKGTRDITPEQKIVRDRMVAAMTDVFSSYGFLPLETPSFERFEVLASKYTGGEEILKEIFTFQDQGKRSLALRYDLTVPFARYIAMNPTLKMPFKRYAIGRVYRDGPIKRGRLREFYQCDADIVGSSSMVAEANLVMLAADVFARLGLSVDLRINNRKLLNGILLEAGVRGELLETTILSIDKLEKMGKGYVEKELSEKGVSEDAIGRLFALLEKKTLADLTLTNDEGNAGKAELEELFALLDATKTSYTFDPTLARGLAYYTGTVFEGFLTEELTGVAVCGGGRYDTMIGKLIGSKQEFPAVGISFGLEVLSEVLKGEEATTTQLYIAPIGDVLPEALALAKRLRASGVKVDMDLNGRGISKNLAYAQAYHIRHVLIVGEDEVKASTYQLKDLSTGEQKPVSEEDLAASFL